ncbi:uncharacterized protein ACLA_038970 [Aspergillus clavatus NRRL 1]|uniref:Aminoglycoside phosphotransferase domain-containing protein n=1 Tax=Aspergillus clavatus (strain ATCC 1007 / CBS 513.65 / DSM 816 / NCTC 3887 / NRRL 1 / QM 1276 / 107) TaxID=344612 RepID=A1CKK8_ASPCL|nr:uncharacterized protein ACLA_038970 [Aspergillus clavatus NRRL 1]EAW09682.1 conserved hypothetical protein [Aspergillus clavatus NRRL 1]
MSPIRELPAPVGVEPPNKLSMILGHFLPPAVNVRSIQSLDGHLHSLRLLTLSNGARLLLKSAPRSTTPLLRREQSLLWTEARVLSLLKQSSVPCIPSLLHYEQQNTRLGPAFLLRQYLPGPTLDEMASRLTTQGRQDIDRQLGFLVNVIGQHIAHNFGSLEQVALGTGTRSWREAFLALFESILRDSEDVFVHLPYAEIRHQICRLSPVLDDVKVPRLVICDFGRPSTVLLDPVSKKLLGVVGLGSALWGDVYLAQIFEDPSPAVLDGFASRHIGSEPHSIRQLFTIETETRVQKLKQGGA